MVVAVFDSGFGGLSLLYEAMKKLEGCDFIYFADNENAPYGTKSIDEIKALSIDAVDFLASKADIVVIACNTATSAAVSDLREKFNIPIIGMEPAVNLGKDADGDILVIATPATIKGVKLNELLKKSNLNNKTHLLPMPKLVEFAQNMEFNSPNVKEYIKNQISKFNSKNISLLVLGCTHFNYFKDSFIDLMPNSKIVDGVDGTIRQIKRKIDELNSKGKNLDTKLLYYSSKKQKDINLITPFLSRLDKMAKI
ncbi:MULTISPECIES: glutamate racemase [Campylobacter]|uniref:Glutamate racemase n=1 Tax=Campylobacter vicugnae TaxID=1660076 RepID=A0ABZ2E673_9BACT|nr:MULTISPECIES: glutamate racemase [unclassified Campylobacter]ARR04286.1 glutamate racemase [Campylobacter sp. RM12175]MCR8702033.1 glutamate racemase [Campylobacter sp. RM12176]